MTPSRSGAVLFANNVDRLSDFYSAVLALDRGEQGDGYVVLESPAFQLVVHAIPPGRDSTVAIPPTRRANAAIKPVFFIQNLTAVRNAAASSGGVMEAPDREWSFQGTRVCDCLDPEGNVIQFRQVAADSPLKADS